jgi:uncharacterized protein
MRTFAAIFLILHLPLFFYPVLRLCHWLEFGQLTTILILTPVAASQVISRWWLRGARSWFAKRVRQIADFVLGMSPITIMALLVAEIAVAGGLAQPYGAAWAVVAVTVVVSIYGLIMAIRPMVRRIALTAGHLQRPVRIVQITDVHIGSRSSRFLDRIVDRILELEPDFLCITGDFVDAPGITERELASLGKIECPIYFCIGNHERYEDLQNIVERLEHLGVVVLRNRHTKFREDVQVIGIDDRDDALQVERVLDRMTLDDESFVVLMYHRPHGFEAAARKGIDLMLSGHTHNGQIFPFHLVVKSAFDRVAGLYELGQSRLYVSQGTGTWGPVMRVGTRAEITLFEYEGSRD